MIGPLGSICNRLTENQRIGVIVAGFVLFMLVFNGLSFTFHGTPLIAAVYAIFVFVFGKKLIES